MSGQRAVASSATAGWYIAHGNLKEIVVFFFLPGIGFAFLGLEQATTPFGAPLVGFLVSEQENACGRYLVVLWSLVIVIAFDVVLLCFSPNLSVCLASLLSSLAVGSLDVKQFFMPRPSPFSLPFYNCQLAFPHLYLFYRYLAVRVLITPSRPSRRSSLGGTRTCASAGGTTGAPRPFR